MNSNKPKVFGYKVLLSTDNIQLP